MNTDQQRDPPRLGFLVGVFALWFVFCACAVFEFWPVTRYTELARGGTHHWVAFVSLCAALAFAAWYSRRGTPFSRWLTIFNVDVIFAASVVFIELALSPAASGKGSGGVVVMICLAAALCAAFVQSVFLAFTRHA